MKKARNKTIHFVGIAGTAMASLARAFGAAGFEVTGSEPKEIFPPMSDYLKNNKVKYYTGFDGSKIGNPNEVVVGNAHYSDQNPEVLFARENKLELEHFPRLAEKYLIKKNSVVVAGTYGKTTITSMASWLLEKAGKNPNYMVGGIPLNSRHGARLTNTNWSVVEGDEYPAASPWDFSPKFYFYHPKYLILTSAEWDHMDIYKTKASYIKVFKELVRSVPKDGLIVAKHGGENLGEVLEQARCRVVFYSADGEKEGATKTPKNIYRVNAGKIFNHKIEFQLNKNGQSLASFQTSLIGDFNLENWAAVLALAYELKLPVAETQAAVKTFKGVKRRLEVRGVKNDITVIDDFAHSPSKAKQSVYALRKYFPKGRVFIIFEPNRGGRSTKCLKKYDHAFEGAYKVIIPRLNDYTPRPGVKDVTGKELSARLKITHKSVCYQPVQDKIIELIMKQTKPGDVVAFLGSRNFDEPIKKVLRGLVK